MTTYKLIRFDYSAILVLLWMEKTHWKKKLGKDLLKGIKHSMQMELFMKVTWCPGNPN